MTHRQTRTHSLDQRTARAQAAHVSGSELRQALTPAERDLVTKLCRWHEADTIHEEEAATARRLLRRLRPPPIRGIAAPNNPPD